MKRLALFLAAAALLCGQIPEIPYDSTPNLLKLPEHLYLGEAAGVATNSKGNIFVYTRTGTATATLGGSRTFTRGGARLFEFTASGTFVREIGQGVYGFVFAHVVRVDPQDNIWVVDEGANMVIEFNPQGRIVMTLGRKPEDVRVPAAEAGPGRGAVAGDNFNRPTDVAWDAAGNIFVADGYGNSRVAKFDKNGTFIKSWGTKGKEPGQFDLLHSMAIDPQGNVYIGDRSNRRIQVFDNDGKFKTEYTNVGAPYAICISSGTHPYLFSSNSNPSTSMENGEIYKMELDGQIVGKFGKAGKLLGQFGTVHEIDCRNPNQVFVGELTNWRVQKLTLH
jgi:DNA-binding beta-propeller fold protein YncE